jgi:hypothetical protein
MKSAVVVPDDQKPRRILQSAGLLLSTKERVLCVPVARSMREVTGLVVLSEGFPMRKQDLFLDCLKTTVDVYQHGTLNRWETVAFMATCIDVHMRQDPADARTSPEIRDAGAVPRLEFSEPLKADDRDLLELYAEATRFWAAGYGNLRLIK